MGPRATFRRHDRHQFRLDLIGCLPLGKFQPMGDAEHMGVDGDGGLDVQFVQYDAGGFAADARQRLQGLSVQWNLAAVLLQQYPGKCDDVLCLGALEPD